MHAKARTGGERVQVWIRLGQGESRVNRAACRHDWGCTGLGWDVTVVTVGGGSECMRVRLHA